MACWLVDFVLAYWLVGLETGLSFWGRHVFLNVFKTQRNGPKTETRRDKKRECSGLAMHLRLESFFFPFWGGRGDESE